MKRILLIAATLMLGVSFGFAQGISGTWNGTLSSGTAPIRLVFHINETAAGYSATMDSPDQGAKDIPVSVVKFSDNLLKIEIAALRVVYEGTYDGTVIKGTFTQAGAPLPMELRRGEVKINRPQTPQPPFPYNTDYVEFENTEAGITLSGTFTYPREGGKFPAIVLLTGSGAHNRDEDIFNHKIFAVIADHLTRRGIAVLRFDDRGVAASGGVYATATIHDFASDGRAAFEYLRCRPEVNQKKVGVGGHSLGGTHSIMIASGNRDVAFMVSLAGVSIDGKEFMEMQRKTLSAAKNVPEEDRMKAEALIRRIIDWVLANPSPSDAQIDALITEIMPAEAIGVAGAREQIKTQIVALMMPEVLSLLQYDPTEDLKQIRCPALALNGDKDLQVLSDVNLAAFQEYVRGKVTVKKYPGLNHLFQHSETGLLQEYAQIEETISPEVLADIADWINETTGNRDAR